MLNNTITVKTEVLDGIPPVTAINRAYALQSILPTASLYADPSAGIDTPRTLRVSHEVTGSGVVNSAIIIDQMVDSGDVTVEDSLLRGLIKLSYDPEFATTDQIKSMLVEMACMILAGIADDSGYSNNLTIVADTEVGVLLTLDKSSSTGISITKLLNKEH